METAVDDGRSYVKHMITALQSTSVLECAKRETA